MPPKKSSADSMTESVRTRRSSKKTTSPTKQPSSSKKGSGSQDELVHSLDVGLNASGEFSHASPKGSGTANALLDSPKTRVDKPRKTSVSSPEMTGFSEIAPQTTEGQNNGETAVSEESAASKESPFRGWPFLETRFMTALIFYLVFAVALVALTVWNPIKPTVSSGEESLGIVDLTGRQGEFEAEWQKKLQDLEINSETWFQTSSSRLREESFGGIHSRSLFSGDDSGVARWIRSEVKVVFPEAVREDQLIKTGGAWKELCESLGYTVSKTTWGYSQNKLWVVLDSETDIERGDRRLSLPMQKITLIQPLAGKNKKRFNLRGLIPENPPALTAVAPNPFPKTKTSIVPTIKPNSPPAKILNSQPQLPQKPMPTFKPGPTSVPLPSSKPLQVKIRAKVAIIIDDVGATHDESTEAFLQVPARLTWSVMPLMPYGDHYMAAGKDHGFEIMLHLPLEPLDAKINPGPGIIKASWPEEEIRQKLEDDLKSVPDAVGINNHMGSAGTSDDRLMNILMQAIKQKGLYFVDSMTYKTSVAGTYAKEYRVPFGKREVFIDNQSTLESKKKQLRELISKALKNGSAIGIGHVRPNTAEAISEMLPEFVKAGVAIVPASELVR